jgi:cardiolipin synthase A/B
MYNTSSIDDMKYDFFETLRMCRQIKIEDITNIKLHKALTRAVLRIFAPLM